MISPKLNQNQGNKYTKHMNNTRCMRNNDCKYHGIEIGEAIDKGWSFGEALLEGVAEVVGRISGDDEDGGSNLRE